MHPQFLIKCAYLLPDTQLVGHRALGGSRRLGGGVAVQVLPRQPQGADVQLQHPLRPVAQKLISSSQSLLVAGVPCLYSHASGRRCQIFSCPDSHRELIHSFSTPCGLVESIRWSNIDNLKSSRWF